MDPLYDVGKVRSFMTIVNIVGCGWISTSISFTMSIVT